MSFGFGLRIALGNNQHLGVAIDPGLAFLATSQNWADATDVDDGSEQSLPNRGTSGDTVQRGSTAGVDANDPTFTPAAGEVRASADYATNDFLQHPASDTPTFTATAGKYVRLDAFTRATTPPSAETLWSSESASARGVWAFINSASANIRYRIGGTTGSGDTPVQAYTVGDLVISALIVVDGDAYSWSLANGLSTVRDISGYGTIAHIAPKTGARAYSSSSPFNGQTFMSAWWDDADLPDTVAEIVAKLEAAGALIDAGGYE